MSERLVSNFHKAVRALITRKVFIETDRIPFEFENVPVKKILNWIITEASVYFKPSIPLGFPTHLQIEPSNLCNLKCSFCPVTMGMDRPSGNMDFDVFKKLIDETGNYVFIILFWDWGEPFLNPRAYDMIAYAKKKKIKIISSTNGHVFAKQDHAEKLVLSGIDAIIFAVDGITQKTYQTYRGKGNLETVITGIRNVARIKKELNSETPLINFRFLTMRHNEHEIHILKEFAEYSRSRYSDHKNS